MKRILLILVFFVGTLSSYRVAKQSIALFQKSSKSIYPHSQYRNPTSIVSYSLPPQISVNPKFDYRLLKKKWLPIQPKNKIVTLFISFAAIVFSTVKSVHASTLPKLAIFKKSSQDTLDLYGRVPYDDWLFANWRLTDPNLLKRSFVECVSSI